MQMHAMMAFVVFLPRKGSKNYISISLKLLQTPLSVVLTCKIGIMWYNVKWASFKTGPETNTLLPYCVYLFN